MSFRRGPIIYKWVLSFIFGHSAKYFPRRLTKIFTRYSGIMLIECHPCFSFSSVNLFQFSEGNVIHVTCHTIHKYSVTRPEKVSEFI